MTQRLSVLALFGLLLSGPLAAQENIAVDTARLLGIGSSGLCSNCHATSSTATINRWSKATQRVTECLQETDDQEKLNCIAQGDASSTFEVSASQLGIYSTGPAQEPLRSVILSNYGTTQGNRILSSLNASSMPLNGRKLTAGEFANALSWFNAGVPGLADILEPTSSTGNSAVCSETISSDLTNHIRTQSLESWSAYNKAQGLAMFGCSSGSCFTQQRNGVDVFPDTSEVAGLETVKFDLSSQMRVLTNLTGRGLQYWIRSSADGRFVGFGGTPRSGIVDLQPLLTSAASTRTISIAALYDPGFFPDSSAFVFQGSSTGFCNMSILKKSTTTAIDFEEDECTNMTSDATRLPLYQSVGASIDGGDYLAITSSYQRDAGSSLTFDEHMPGEEQMAGPNNSMRLYPLQFDGQSWRRGAAQSFRTPYEIDWVLAHSSKLAVSRLQAEQDGVIQTQGFRIHSFTKNSSGSFVKKQVAQICTDGLKGDFSYDDRFFINYSYVRPDHWKVLGYASANDPAFRQKLATGSADVYLYDLYTQKRYTITNVKPNQYALYPHFRSDGWIYFEIYDATANKRTVVASDVAVKIQNETPVR